MCRLRKCCSAELAALGRNATVLNRHTMWSFYQFRWCCSTELAAPDRHAAVVPLFYHRCVGLDGAAVLDMQHLTQKYKNIVILPQNAARSEIVKNTWDVGGDFLPVIAA